MSIVTVRYHFYEGKIEKKKKMLTRVKKDNRHL